MDFEKDRDVEAPFNMAIATLMRLDSILKEIRLNNRIYPKDSPEKQNAYIGLIKQFYMNAVPLFQKEDKDLIKIGKEILDLKVERIITIKSGAQKYVYTYDSKLERRLDELLIEIQIKLKRFFMPEKRDVEGLI